MVLGGKAYVQVTYSPVQKSGKSCTRVFKSADFHVLVRTETQAVSVLSKLTWPLHSSCSDE